LVPSDELQSRAYLRINAKDQPGVIAQVTSILGEAGISVSALMQHEMAADQFVPVALITHQCRQGSLLAALKKIEALPVINGKPAVIRIVDLPK